MMRAFANYGFAFLLIGAALVLSNNVLAEEAGTKSICDTKILGRPGCEVGDFNVARALQVKIMYDRSIPADRKIQLITSPQLLAPEELRHTSPQLLTPEELRSRWPLLTPEELRSRWPQDGVQELINRVRAVFPLDSRSSESEQLGPIRDIREAPINYGRGQGYQITPDSQLNHKTGQSTKPLHQSGGAIDEESHKR
jgi:hypothetical protein